MDSSSSSSKPTEDPTPGLDHRAKERAYDEKLVARALQGEQAAFEEIYERHRHAVYKVALGMLRNPEDALDVVQETFVKAHKSLARFERRASIGTWLCQIGLHQAIDLQRRRKVRKADQLEEGRVEQQSQLSPGAKAEESELQTALTKALDELSEKHRQVFVLYTVKGLSYKEIAEVVGISVGTVMSRLFYARKNLQGKLAQYAPR
jgi:RNA polymerase sigma-70 factor (ECF subfamily)